ncbi:MAG: malonyl-CoA decarboxylase family protein [Pseudohongiellaceae bacterium]
MAFNRFQDFLGGLVSRQRSLFSSSSTPTMDELLEDLMGNTGEVSAIVAARELLDMYGELDEEGKRVFFVNLEQHYNAQPASVKLAYDNFAATADSASLNRLFRAAEPKRVELLRRLNQTPNATHDLVAMRVDLLRFMKELPALAAVDENFTHLFRSWFSRGFLLLETINWSTSAAILERIIRYEAVHEIKDWKDLRSRIDPPNRRCFAFFHPALIDEPLIFVEVALGTEIPGSINSILEDNAHGAHDLPDFTTATFYSISNCQPGLQNITFGNFLIKQVVQELRHEFPSIKKFVTLSPVPGFNRWLQKIDDNDAEALTQKKREFLESDPASMEADDNGDQLRKMVFNYLVQAKRGKYPADPVARFHLGNGAMLHNVHTHADRSAKGQQQAYGCMVNYLYDLRYIERNHELYMTEGKVDYSDKLKSMLIKG